MNDDLPFPLLVIAGLSLAVVLLSIPIGFYEYVRTAKLERECLSLGYSRADWRWIGPNYCVTRTDQTDIVVVVDSARKGRP